MKTPRALKNMVEELELKQNPKKEGELNLDVKTPSKDIKVKTDVKTSDAPVKQAGSPSDDDMNKTKDSNPPEVKKVGEGKIPDLTKDIEGVMKDLLESRKINEADLKMDPIQAHVAAGLIKWALGQEKVKAESGGVVNWVQAANDILAGGLEQAVADSKGYTISGSLMGPAVGLLGWAIKQPEIQKQSEGGVVNLSGIGNEIINPPDRSAKKEQANAPVQQAPAPMPAPVVPEAEVPAQEPAEVPAEAEDAEEEAFDKGEGKPGHEEAESPEEEEAEEAPKEAEIVRDAVVVMNKTGKLSEAVVEMGDVDVVGTSFHHTVIKASYDDIVKVFGEPAFTGEGDKVQAEWEGTIDGKVFTIYDYKEEQPAVSVTNWHVGGKEKATTDAVLAHFNQEMGKNESFGIKMDRQIFVKQTKSADLLDEARFAEGSFNVQDKEIVAVEENKMDGFDLAEAEKQLKRLM